MGVNNHTCCGPEQGRYHVHNCEPANQPTNEAMNKHTTITMPMATPC